MKKIITSLILVMMLVSGCIGNIIKGPTQKITFNSLPSGADVTVDGSFEGVTPLSLELKRGESHQAVISLAGYEESSFDIHKSLSGAIVVSDVLLFGGSVLYLSKAIGGSSVSSGTRVNSALLSAGFALLFDLVTDGLYNLSPTDIHSSLNNVSVQGSIVDVSLIPNQ